VLFCSTKGASQPHTDSLVIIRLFWHPQVPLSRSKPGIHYEHEFVALQLTQPTTLHSMQVVFNWVKLVAQPHDDPLFWTNKSP